MEEYSIGIIKPDAMRHCQEIISIIETQGLKVISQKIVRLDKPSLMEIYKEHIDKDFFQSLCDFMRSSECLAFIVKGNNAIKALNEIVGATDSRKAKPGTIRNKFGTDIQKNAIHSSDTEEHFKRELKILFPDFIVEKSFATRDECSGFLYYTKVKLLH